MTNDLVSSITSKPPSDAPEDEVMVNVKPYPAAPRNLRTELYYIDLPDGAPAPVIRSSEPSTYFPPTAPHNVLVRDIRGVEARFTLDSAGFQVVQHASTEKDFVDKDKIRLDYYPQMIDLLKTITGCTRVHIMSHVVRDMAEMASATRRADTRGAAAAAAAGSPSASTRISKHEAPKFIRHYLKSPVKSVHIDFSLAAGAQLVRQYLSGEARRLLAGRFQIINIWRPIRTIRRDPLAVADVASIHPDDFLPMRMMYPDRSVETYALRPAPPPRSPHRWHYLSRQTPDEVLLLKICDSRDGEARGTPHSAFTDPEFEEADVRRSIELRCLVFYELGE